MELAGRIRWLALAGPLALAAAGALAQPAPPGVALAARAPAEPMARPPVERSCPADAGRTTAAAGPAWYRLEPLLDASGALAGQRLTVGAASARWSVSLPPESFASGPVGGRVLVGDDDGQRSRLRTLDAALGCWTTVATSSDVVRSAVLAPGGARAYEHRVDRATRLDLGVWARDLATAEAAPLVAGLPADPEYGVTFSTSVLAVDDGRVVVSACGERACRTRVVDPVTGRSSTAAGTGPAVGLADQRLVVLEACDGLPCAIDSIDLASGDSTRLGEANGAAVVAPGGAGAIVLMGGGRLGVLRLGGQTSETGVQGSAGLAPILAASTAESGAEAPDGSVAVAPGGRVTDPTAIRFLDPSSLQLSAGEVLP